MPSLTDISPETLLVRHRLSPQHINSLFGEPVIRESFDEKATSFGKVVEFLRVTDAFSAGGISFIPLKGTLLSHRLYGDATWRQYCDLDIMVDVKSVSKAVSLLHDLGYIPRYHAWPESRCGQRVISNHMHHVYFSHPVSGMNIELHWRLFQTLAVSISKIENLVKKYQFVENFAGRTFTVLSNELELLYLLMHGSIHSWRRLKWLVDAEAYIRTRIIDWKLFEKLIKELKAERLVSVGKSILAEYFPEGPSLPFDGSAPRFMKEYTLEKIRETEDGDHESLMMILKRWRYSFLSYQGGDYKISRIWNYLLFYGYGLFNRTSKLNP